MEYIEGHHNRVSDALSRLGFQKDMCEDGVDCEEVDRTECSGFQQDRCEDGVDCEEVARTKSSETTKPTVRSVSQMCSVLVGDIWSLHKFIAAQMDDTLLGEVCGLLILCLL